MAPPPLRLERLHGDDQRARRPHQCRRRVLAARAGERAATALALDLKLGTLDAYGKRLHDLTLRAGADPAGWSANLQSEEISGDVSYRNEAGGQLVARLTQARIPDDYPGAKPDDAGRSKELPALDLIAERFTFRDKRLGHVELKAQRAGDE